MIEREEERTENLHWDFMRGSMQRESMYDFLVCRKSLTGRLGGVGIEIYIVSKKFKKTKSGCKQEEKFKKQIYTA